MKKRDKPDHLRVVDVAPSGEIVQKALAVPRPWKWGKVKREVLKMTLKGYSAVMIAKETGVHRNTIRRWKNTPEFQQALVEAAREYRQQHQLKRVHETGVILDQLAAQVAVRLAALNQPATPADDGNSPLFTQTDLNMLQTFMREYREFRAQERADFGETQKRVEGQINIGFSGLTGGAAAPAADTVLTQNFLEFMTQRAPVLPEIAASSDQDALIKATRALLDGELLDALLAEKERAADE